jgi:hypothetical protein
MPTPHSVYNNEDQRAVIRRLWASGGKNVADFQHNRVLIWSPLSDPRRARLRGCHLGSDQEAVYSRIK